MRPALIRCTCRTSSPSSVGKRRCLPRRPAPARRRPSSAESGGSNVFNVATWAGPALATGERASGRSSLAVPPPPPGNSGIVFLLVDALNVAVTRGDLVESRHRVHAVVVNGGAVVEAWGDPELVVYVRSSAKPLQALPLVEHDLPTEELAIACASHEARPGAARRRAGPARAGRRRDGRPRVRRRARLAPSPQLLGQARRLPLPLPGAWLGDGGLPTARPPAPGGAPHARGRHGRAAGGRDLDRDRRLRRCPRSRSPWRSWRACSPASPPASRKAWRRSSQQ